MGKTFLADVFVARAKERGYRCRRAATSSAACDIQFGAFAHILPRGLDLSRPVSAFEAARTALAGRRRGRRGVVIVDDVHLLDAASAVTLRQLMSAKEIFLLGTLPPDAPAGSAGRELVRSWGMWNIDLGPVEEKDVEELFRTRLAQPIARHSVRALHQHSRGNPLYLRELVLGGMNSGALAFNGGLWELDEARPLCTPLLKHLVKLRLSGVTPRGHEAIRLLAVCGPLSLADVERLAPLDELADLERNGLIHVTSAKRRTSVTMMYPFYGEAVRAGIRPSQRRRLLLGQVQRTLGYGARRRQDALRMAMWQQDAGAAVDPALLRQAARTASESDDCSQVVKLLHNLPAQDHTLQSRLLLGRALFQLGQAHSAEEILSQISPDKLEEPEKIGVGLLRVTNLLWAARIDDAGRANEALRHQADSTGVHAAVQANQAMILMASRRFAHAREILEDLEGGDAAAALDPQVRAWLYGTSLAPVVQAMQGRPTQAVAWARKAHAMCFDSSLSEPTPFSHPSTRLPSLVLALTEQGNLHEALSMGSNAFTDPVQAGMPSLRLWLAIFLGRAEWLAGRLHTARHWYAEAIALGLRGQSPAFGAMRLALSGIAACLAVTGDTTGAETALTELNQLAPNECGLLPRSEENLGQAWLHASQGRLTAARTILQQAAHNARAHGHITSEALLLTDLARLGGAHDVHARMTELAALCDGHLAPARAAFVNALATQEPAELLDAATELQRLGLNLAAAEAFTEASASWRRGGDNRRAVAAFLNAQIARSACPTARTPILQTKENQWLTPREQEIAQLAADGLSSADIAHKLQLSIRTIGNHLQHIYAKIGVTSRNNY
jgi:DNA-binding CsgD family transcriptional regulator